MAIDMKVQLVEDILFVESWGTDSSIDEVLGYERAVLTKAREFNVKKIICDESNLKYNLGLKATYKLVRYIKEANPGEIYVALITQEVNYLEAVFFEQLVNDSGLTMRYFPQIEKGLKWLKSITTQQSI